MDNLIYFNSVNVYGEMFSNLSKQIVIKNYISSIKWEYKMRIYNYPYVQLIFVFLFESQINRYVVIKLF